jgi:group II intron reverse transcriptase/maturase
MQKAEAVLNILRDRGKRGLPVTELYRQLFNQDHYLRAYGKIYSNTGAMTPGVTNETVDGMSLAKIHRIIEVLRRERYHFQPVRRVYIEKKNSTTKRPLGIPPWSDKIVQEVVRSLLEAYYEPQFDTGSHGFRPERGCHTALQAIKHVWTGTVWFIEGDISKCFDSLDHDVLLSILGDKVKDNRFLELIRRMLKAGYLEEWRYNATISGTPQGGVVSPLLSNIYLDQLDQWVRGHLIPKYTSGDVRSDNKEYNRIRMRISRAHKRGDLQAVQAYRKILNTLPAMMVDDPNYRRLRYVRYADDFLLGFAGPRSEADDIKRSIGDYLQDTLKLQMSVEKTLITHGRTETARFLGYGISVDHNDTYRDGTGRRTANGGINLEVPPDVVTKRTLRYMRDGRVMNRPELLRNSVYTIIMTYQQEYRGFVQYYALARNRSRRLRILKSIMNHSLVMTLCNKLRVRTKELLRRYKRHIPTVNGPRVVLLEVVQREGKEPLVATWGGISLARPEGPVVIKDEEPKAFYAHLRSEAVMTLLYGECAICGSSDDIEMHHIRALKDLWRKREKPDWAIKMSARKRKFLPVCLKCHQEIHRGKYDGVSPKKLSESRMR